MAKAPSPTRRTRTSSRSNPPATPTNNIDPAAVQGIVDRLNKSEQAQSVIIKVVAENMALREYITQLEGAVAELQARLEGTDEQAISS